MHILTVILIILLALLLIVMLAIAYKAIFSPEGDKLIKGARERLENQIYDLEDRITVNGEKFMDSAELVLPFSKADVVFDRHQPVNRYCFFNSLGIDADALSIEDNSVALLMPFNSRFDKQYNTIREACDEAGMICHRSDEKHNPGNLLAQIVEMILSCQIIVAVIDGKNPNVFYEIGIAHSIGKPVILVASKARIDELPQDLASERLLLYDNMPDLKNKLSKALNQISYSDR